LQDWTWAASCTLLRAIEIPFPLLTLTFFAIHTAEK